MCRFFNQICENKLLLLLVENWHNFKLPKIVRSVKLIQYYSILVIRVLSRGERATARAAGSEAELRLRERLFSKIYHNLPDLIFCRILANNLAKFGFDTVENEPCKVCPLSFIPSHPFQRILFFACG